MNAITRLPAGHTHADAAAIALRHMISTVHGPLRQAVEAYRTASAGLAPDADLQDILCAAGEIALAAEAIATASKQAEATARTALASCMAEIGCPSVALAGHVVHLSTKPARVDIEDQAVIPAELMRTPPRAPDKVAIAKLLRAGAAVPGARLISSNEPICVFKGTSS